MQERRQSLIAIRSIQVPLILQSVLASFILINVVLIIAFLVGAGLSGPVGRLYLAIAVAAVEILCLAGVFFAARKQSSQIVGPLYRVEELAKRLRDGDLTARAEIRSGDYFVQQIGALDDALQDLHDRVHDLKRKVRDAGQGPPEEIGRELEWFQTRDSS